MFDGLGSSAAHIKAGRIKALAVASDKRAPGFPDVPATAEVITALTCPAESVTVWRVRNVPGPSSITQEILTLGTGRPFWSMTLAVR
jgi:hypothetical protein